MEKPLKKRMFLRHISQYLRFSGIAMKKGNFNGILYEISSKTIRWNLRKVPAFLFFLVLFFFLLNYGEIFPKSSFVHKLSADFYASKKCFSVLQKILFSFLFFNSEYCKT